jgi:predicted O-methyltransferase YrrM
MSVPWFSASNPPWALRQSVGTFIKTTVRRSELVLTPQRYRIDQRFTPDGGCAFVAPLHPAIRERIYLGAEACLSEDGKPLPWPNTPHENIRELGGGTYSIGRDVHFSASDGSDPRSNGRHYELMLYDWPRFYDDTDRDAVSGAPQRLTRTLVTAYATRHAASPRFSLIKDLRAFSMLHEETLLLMHYFGLRARGAVLELGAYLGAGTVATALALKETGWGPQITIEVGGAYDHPQLPSSDIIKDLKENIVRFGVEEVVHVVQGWAHERTVIAEVERLLGGRAVDLLVIDADGEIEKHFSLYERFLSDECLIVIDDFIMAVEPSKDVGVREWIAKAADAGIVRDLGVHKWATWFGQYQRRL